MFKLSLQYIKYYKKRTFSVLAAIILSVAVIASIIILSQSANQANIDSIKYDEGSYHAVFTKLDNDQIEKIKKDKSIKDRGFAEYYDSVALTDDFYLNILRADKEYIKLGSSFSGNSFIKEGRYPEKDNEIAVEEWVLNVLGKEPKVGSDLQLKLEDRRETKTYKLVGILKDRPEFKRSMTLQAFLPISDDFKGNRNISMVTFKDENNINKLTSLLAKKLNVKSDDIVKNTTLIEAYGKLNNIYKNNIFSLLVILVASFIVIYGIYSISILQRISEYGILSAIGSSRKQLMEITLYELLILSAMGVPIGIILGLIGSKLLSGLVGNVFTEGAVNISRLVITKEAFIIPVIVTAAVILLIVIAVYITISKISSIEAIRKNLGLREKCNNKIYKKVASGKNLSIYSIVTIRNILSNSRSFIMIILSISIAGILFINASYLSFLEERQVDNIADSIGYNSDYKINLVPGAKKTDGLSSKELERIRALNGVRDLSAIQVIYSRLMLSSEHISEPMYFENLNSTPYIKDLMNGMLVKNLKATDKLEEYILKDNMYGYDDKSLAKLRKYLVKGKIDIDRMKKENLAIVRIPNPINTENKRPYVANFKVGDEIRVAFSNKGTNSEESWKINYNDDSYEYKEYTVAAIVNNLLDYDNYYTVNNSVDVVLSSDIFKKDTGITQYKIISINKERGVNHNVLYKKIKSIIDMKPGVILRDLDKEIENFNILNENKHRFINAIVMILFIMGVFNIANNIKYNIASRMREFGMLRAVGTTNKSLKEMFLAEGFLYGAISSVVVIIFGVLVQYILYNKYLAIYINPIFKIQYREYLIVIIINFIVTIATTYLSSMNIRKTAVVDMIKNDQ